jgi:peroxiredoxin
MTAQPRRIAGLPAGFAVLSALLLLCAAISGHGAEKPVEVGQPVPEFSLNGLDGAPVSFQKNIRGKAQLTILFFMTTACSACFEEMEEIDDFVGKTAAGRVDVWCVAVDLRGAQTVGPFAKSNRFRVKYLVDPKFSLPRVFGFNYTPSLAIVDARGVVLHKKGGYSPSERISDLIRTFLK